VVGETFSPTAETAISCWICATHSDDHQGGYPNKPRFDIDASYHKTLLTNTRDVEATLPRRFAGLLI
jgi:hypothetical protein